MFHVKHLVATLKLNTTKSKSISRYIDYYTDRKSCYAINK